MSDSLMSSIAKTQEIDKAFSTQTGTFLANIEWMKNKHTCNDASPNIVWELNKQYWS